jgi:phosphatidylserine decarboxylase
MTFAKEAWPFVLPFALAAVVALTLQRPRLAVAAALGGLLVLLFFRIPGRASAAPANAILAPANGKITAIGRVENPEFAAGEFHHIVTFLSVFNVHVQRAPATGEVVTSSHRAGRKVAAFRPDAGDVNESQLAVILTESGDTIALRQIAGLLARRVVSYLEVGDRIERGELIGLIKFGSRVDLYLPASYRLKIEPGQTVHEGVTVMAEAAGR